MKLSNRWNRFIYAIWSPVYDLLAGSFESERKRAVESLALARGERVLLPGVGTGLDLPLLASGVEAIGIDLSQKMLEKARHRSLPAERKVYLARADAQAIPLGDASVDAAILNLVLSVVPDGRKCLRETLRVLRPGGRAIIFDKFLPDGAQPSLPRKLLNLLTSFFGTDINRRFGDLKLHLDLIVEREEQSLFGGAYRIIRVRKPDG